MLVLELLGDRDVHHATTSAGAELDLAGAEREQGVSSVAVPIFDASNMPVACLTVSGPIPRFTESMVAELVPAAIESARAISLRLGAELGDGTTLPRPQDD